MDHPPRSPRPRLAVTGAGLVLALAAAAGACSPDGTSSDGPDSLDRSAPLPAPAAMAPVAQGATESDRAAATSTASPVAVALQSGRRASDTSVLVAAALGVAAEHLGPPARTHLVVEAVDQPGPGAAVVVVLGVSWDGLRSEVRRLAVPVLPGPPPAAGPPWELPPPTAAPWAGDPPSLDDTSPRLRALAVDALDRAGYVDVEVLAVAPALEAWPLVTSFRSSTPTGEVVERTVWLRRHLDHLVVAGSPAEARPSAKEDR